MAWAVHIDATLPAAVAAFPATRLRAVRSPARLVAVLLARSSRLVIRVAIPVHPPAEDALFEVVDRRSGCASASARSPGELERAADQVSSASPSCGKGAGPGRSAGAADPGAATGRPARRSGRVRRDYGPLARPRPRNFAPAAIVTRPAWATTSWRWAIAADSWDPNALACFTGRGRRIAVRRDTMTGSTLQLVGCPQCSAPAEITDRFVLESTSGPVEHLTVSCLHRHRFTLPADHLPSALGRNEPGRRAPATN
jgi:hypothetical protein